MNTGQVLGRIRGGLSPLLIAHALSAETSPAVLLKHPLLEATFSGAPSGWPLAGWSCHGPSLLGERAEGCQSQNG